MDVSMRELGATTKVMDASRMVLGASIIIGC